MRDVYTVTSHFDELGPKFGYQKQVAWMRFFQFKVYLWICLSVSIYMCVPVAIYYFGFTVFVYTIERRNKLTNEWTDRQLFLILYSWIVKIYEKCGRKVGWIVKRFGKYRRKVSWIVKIFGKYRRKLWNDMENMDEMWNDME